MIHFSWILDHHSYRLYPITFQWSYGVTLESTHIISSKYEGGDVSPSPKMFQVFIKCLWMLESFCHYYLIFWQIFIDERITNHSLHVFTDIEFKIFRCIYWLPLWFNSLEGVVAFFSHHSERTRGDSVIQPWGLRFNYFLFWKRHHFPHHYDCWRLQVLFDFNLILSLLIECLIISSFLLRQFHH